MASAIFPDGGWTWSDKEELHHFIHGVQTGAPFASSARDTLADVRTFEAIYRRFVEAMGDGV